VITRPHTPEQARLSDQTFRQFSHYIHEHYGIKLPPVKQVMLECRLRKRLRELEMATFEDYATYVFEEGHADEMINMVDVVTTNKTDFFREPHHFQVLRERILPAWKSQRKMELWSAACSTGEEPYTLAMVLSQFAEKAPSFDYRILATDLSTKVLRHAAHAVYAEPRVEPVDISLRKKYLLRSKDRAARRVRIVPELRKKVSFARLNFLEDPYPQKAMDIIFCRNVFIYFDRETQLSILNKFCEVLAPKGYLFIGHSETLNGMELPLKLIESTVYQKA
jgi:chemotaxis protein methyltransferase CheR